MNYHVCFGQLQVAVVAPRRSRCCSTILIRYGSLKVVRSTHSWDTVNLPVVPGPGKIETEDLSFREWECSEHFIVARQREENRVSVLITLGQSGSIRSTEMAEAENLDLVSKVRLSGR